jgi:hypothetical protein
MRFASEEMFNMLGSTAKSDLNSRRRLYHMERFTTLPFGNYTAEYDRVDGSLRLCRSGSQTFLDQDEAQALFDFLKGVLPDRPEKPEIAFSYLEGTDAAWHV